MKFGVLKDIKEGENRVICTPVEVASIVAAGHTVYVQKGAGVGAGFPRKNLTGFVLMKSFGKRIAARSLRENMSRHNHKSLSYSLNIPWYKYGRQRRHIAQVFPLYPGNRHTSSSRPGTVTFQYSLKTWRTNQNNTRMFEWPNSRHPCRIRCGIFLHIYQANLHGHYTQDYIDHFPNDHRHFHIHIVRYNMRHLSKDYHY